MSKDLTLRQAAPVHSIHRTVGQEPGENDVAKRLISLCDRCGEPGDDVRTYTLRLDGTAWEIDLDEKHAKTVTLAEMMEVGRQLDSGIRRGGNSSLDHRIRGVPTEES